MARYLRDEHCVYQVADLRVDTGRRSVGRGQVEIPLPKLSFDLLLTLVEAAPNVVTTETFMDRVWPGLVVGPETVVQRVKLLRDALGDDPKNPTYLAGVRGLGYRMIPTVSRVDEEPLASAAPPSLPAAPPSVAVPSAAEEAGNQTPADPPRKRWPYAAASLLLLAGISIAGWIYLKARPPVAALPAATSVTVAGATKRTVAVMPFEDLSVAHDSGQLALALPQMVLQRLGMVNDLVVIARSSSFSFIGKQLDAREIGSRLDARYLVEGALQRAGDRLRVTAQLVDTQSGRQLKALEFDRGIGDIFALQDDIAEQLAAALQVQLLSADMKRVDRSRGTSLEAYLKYLNSQALLNHWIVKDADEAAAELRRAIALDPKFALAYAELARAQYIAHFLRRGFGKNAQKADMVALINKALQLDPQLGEAYAMRATLEIEADHAAGEQDYRKSILLAPNYGPAYEMYAESLDGLNRGEEGLAMLERAILIDPVAPRSIYYKGLYLQGRNMESAEAAFQRALELGPDFPPSYVRLANNRWENGKVAEAIGLIEKALRVETQSTFVNVSAVAMYLDIGDRQAAGSIFKNSPSDADVGTMIAVFDRQFGKVPHYDIDYAFGVNVPEYAYWIAVERQAVSEGTVAAKIEECRKQLHFDGEGKGYVLAPDADWGVVFALAYFLNLQGEHTAAANLVAALEKMSGQDKQPGHFLAIVALLKNDPVTAVANLSQELHDGHWYMSWLMQRDPTNDPIKADPAILESIDLENSRMAEQRKILERMRAAGDVPRRD